MKRDIKWLIHSVTARYEQLLLFLHKRRTGLIIGAELLAICLLLLGWSARKNGTTVSAALLSGDFFSVFHQVDTTEEPEKKDYIKWVDFTVPSEAMTQAFRYDVATCQQNIHLNWVELLAFLGAKYGGDFSHYQASDLDRLAETLKNGTSLQELTGDMKYYSYYKEAYSAVLDGLVGYYEIEIPASEAPSFALADSQLNEGEPGGGASAQTDDGSAQTDGDPAQADGGSAQTDGASQTGDPSQAGDPPQTGDPQAESQDETEVLPRPDTGVEKVWVTKYGLKAFHPLAKNFPYSHYDDFGVSRSYGFRRQHLGHDMMGQTGTPVAAVESGVVEAIGWNQYGGWRLGIRSFDKKRYYYYAHLRKDYPYQSNLKEGSVVTAGDIIGYMGRTGYSASENTNNIDEPHLHFGIQLIFDESQKEGNNEIWIDCYEIIKFLSINRSESVKVPGTKEWTRIYQMKDPFIGTVTQ